MQHWSCSIAVSSCSSSSISSPRVAKTVCENNVHVSVLCLCCSSARVGHWDTGVLSGTCTSHWLPVPFLKPPKLSADVSVDTSSYASMGVSVLPCTVYFIPVPCISCTFLLGVMLLLLKHSRMCPDWSPLWEGACLGAAGSCQSLLCQRENLMPINTRLVERWWWWLSWTRIWKVKTLSYVI